MSELLIVKTSSLGDVVHNMPAVVDARRARPNTRITWVVEEAFAPLVRLHPAVDEVIPVASRRWRHALMTAATWSEVAEFWRSLRLREFDEVIDTQGLVRSALIARAARGRRHGYAWNSIREPVASLLYDVRHEVARELHAISRNRALVQQVLGDATGAIDYGLDRDRLKITADQGYAVLLHATAQRAKQWPDESWIAVGKALSSKGLKLVLPWGNADERTRAERLANALPGASVPDRRPLDEVARLMAGASLVVGVDTGLLHLAAAFAVPLVAIFVASDPGLTGPMGQGPMAVLGANGASPTVAAVIAAVEQVGRF